MFLHVLAEARAFLFLSSSISPFISQVSTFPPWLLRPTKASILSSPIIVSYQLSSALLQLIRGSKMTKLAILLLASSWLVNARPLPYTSEAAERMGYYAETMNVVETKRSAGESDVRSLCLWISISLLFIMPLIPPQ